MSKYELVNNADGNDRIELDSTLYDDAAEEAFGILGWYILETGEDEDEQN